MVHTLKLKRIGIALGLYAALALGTVQLNLPEAHRWIAPSFWLFTGVPLHAIRYSIIKSFQRGTITVASNTTSNTAAISSVNTTWTALKGTYWNGGTGEFVIAHVCGVTLTNATTITAARGGNPGATGTACKVDYEAVEFWPASLNSAPQSVDVTMTSVASATATITSVNVNKAEVWLRGATSASDAVVAYSQYTQTSLELTNATTVTGVRGAANSTTVFHILGTVVEYK